MELNKFRLVFNNFVLNSLIFKKVSEISKQIGKRPLLGWSEVKSSPYYLAGNGYISQLIDYLSTKRLFDIEGVARVLKNALKGRCDIGTFQYLFGLLDVQERITHCFDYLSEADSDDFEIGENKIRQINSILETASKLGRLDIIKYLLEAVVIPEYKEGGSQFRWDLERAVSYSAKSNDIELLKFMIEKSNNSIAPFFYTMHERPNVFDKVASVGNIKMIEYLVECRMEDLSESNMLRESIRAGQQDFVRHLLANNSYGHIIGDFEILHYAIRYNQFEILKMLNQEYGMKEFYKYDMNYAADNANIEMLSWLSQNSSCQCSPSAMDTAARNGQFHIVQWLHNNRTEGCTAVCFINIYLSFYCYTY
ncbi:hypothetical protein PPL_07699 [Heterostelium album PN500]|uniref:Ankyrin repeat protein n=1 Tax=Heterostelium pallidum (strain ATCC 26659 / Pp 5 / PN500) TaxID=670386 RepID=D3BGP7_HETP5|nr:hypothetical protein PPL_07699 [Heterostelium album PN500]EFA79281.1 hypothetical protein PPL_07699 [Heterostelium album PN500]|eukprot:XP_020431402.1 hypothetical protein PPL_07699 [Heterostelium album PN500]